MIERYWHLSPDFVIELRSQTDRVRTLREKMREWIDNGVQLAWLIDPDTRTVENLSARIASPEILANPESLKGEGPVEGFVLDLQTVWDPPWPTESRPAVDFPDRRRFYRSKSLPPIPRQPPPFPAASTTPSSPPTGPS